MLTIREIEANAEGKRQFEIVDLDRTTEINPEKQNKNTKGALVSVDGNTCIVKESGYKIGVDETTGEAVYKPCIFLPAENSVNQLGIALSKFDAKTKDMEEKVVELSYRESHPRNSTSAPKSSKIEKYATEEQKARLAQLEEAVKDRAESQTCTEEDIEAYKIAMAEYNLAQAYAKRDGTECTMAKPRNPQRSTGTFIDLLTEEEYAEYQAIVEACEEAKKNAPRASRKLSDDEKIARKEKAIAEKKAAFLAKYGRQI